MDQIKTKRLHVIYDAPTEKLFKYRSIFFFEWKTLQILEVLILATFLVAAVDTRHFYRFAATITSVQRHMNDHGRPALPAISSFY